MPPKPVVTEVGNQATPFAEDFLDNLMSGDVGYATDLQRQVGDAFSSYMAQGPQFFDQTDQFAALQDIWGQNTKQGAADLTEKFSMGGGRYGTGAGTGLGRFFAMAGAQQNALLGGLASQNYNLGMDRFLATLGGAGRFGNEALNPFVTMASQGIVNPAVHMQENPWVTGINTGANVVAAANPFGGAAPAGNTYNTYGS